MFSGGNPCRWGAMAFARHSPSARKSAFATATATTTTKGAKPVIFRHLHIQHDRRYLHSSPLVLLSTAMPPNSSDRSAISKSRAPFRMPKNSADDSAVKHVNVGNNNKSSSSDPTLSWNRLGLLMELCSCLKEELKLPEPTPVQSLVIPQLLNYAKEKESLAFLAATG
jgi:hypothetical protein